MGPFSLTGQPNAMGGREVGGLANQLAAHMDFEPQAVERVARFWNAPRMAACPGLKAVEMFEAVADRRVKALWIMGTNPAVSPPNAGRVRDALRACDFVAVSDCTPDTDTATYSRAPARGGLGREGRHRHQLGAAHLAPRAFLPLAGGARPDWWIITEVARRAWVSVRLFRTRGLPKSSANMRPCPPENGGTRIFDIGGLAGLTDADTTRSSRSNGP